MGGLLPVDVLAPVAGAKRVTVRQGELWGSHTQPAA
jgi:hypothetical protein